MIALVGASGYVGSAYQRLFSKKGIECRSIPHGFFQTASTGEIAGILRSMKAEFLICAAGYTGKPNVDGCEIHKTECLYGNAVFPGLVRRACEAAKVPWGHVSSGCIYSGSKSDGSGFSEDDAPNFTFRQNNCSFYSGCKALGEEILWDDPNCYLWRLRIPFNEVDNPRNYLSKLMRYDSLLEATNSISQIDEFVAATWACWEKRVPKGIYNITNPGAVSTREVVELIRKSGVCAKEFQFFKNESEFMKRAAKTPRSNCVLDTTKLQNVGIRLTEVREAIQRALSNWKSR